MATKVKTKTGRVKTYRVLRDGMRVGHSVRDFGDFMPEAESLPTLRTLLNTDVIEKVYVDQDEFDDWEKDQKKRDAKAAKGIDPDEDTPEDDEGQVSSVKKRVAKKRPAKKTVAKKTVKKGKTSGKAEAAGKRLTGKSV